MMQVLMHVVVHVADSRSPRRMLLLLHVQMLLLLEMLKGILGTEQRICGHHQAVAVQLGPVNRSSLQRDRGRCGWGFIAQHDPTHICGEAIATVVCSTRTRICKWQSHHLFRSQRIPYVPGSARRTSVGRSRPGHFLQHGWRHVRETLPNRSNN